MNEPSEKKHRRWPRWFRYSLRTLLVVILLVSVWLGWWTNEVRKRRRAIEAFRQTGADISFHHEFDADGNWLDDAATPPGPAWLRGMLGDDFFFRVHSITTAGATDKTLAYLDHLDDVRILDLSDSEVTAAGLSHVRRHKNLWDLMLHRTRVTDDALRHLRDLKQLETLELFDTDVTDAGLRHISGLKRLWYLDLRDTNITDAGLNHLRGLNNLEHLLLHPDGTRVTRTGIDQLKRALPRMKGS